MAENINRHLKFSSVVNFRDIGGYRGYRGQDRGMAARVPQRGVPQRYPEDLARLTKELGVNYVIDLRSEFELKNNGKGLLTECDIKYCNIAFMTMTTRCQLKALCALPTWVIFMWSLCGKKSTGSGLWKRWK